jgi:DNA-directed RNA polymerase subunit L
MPQNKLTISEISFNLPSKLNDLVDDLIPAPRNHAEIHLFDTPVCVANAIRRVIMNETPTMVLTTELENVKTDGTMPNDFILDRLEMLPIIQGVKITGSLEIRNNTKGLINVMSSDLDLRANGKPYEVEDSYRLAILRQNTFLKISNITSELKTGGRASIVDNLTYKILPKKGGDYKLTNNIGDFLITFDTNGTYEVEELLVKVFEILLTKLENLLEFLTSGQDNTDYYEFSRKMKDSYEIKFNNEKTTFGEILMWFTYDADKSIPLVNYVPVHVTENKMYFNWTHASGKKIIEVATMNAIKRIESIRDSLI